MGMGTDLQSGSEMGIKFEINGSGNGNGISLIRLGDWKY